MRNIVVEGPDASGKSTLIRELKDHLPHLRVKEGEGPPDSQKVFDDRVYRYSGYHGRIFDRHPVVSEWVYGHYRQGPQIKVSHHHWAMFEMGHPLVVYCHAVVTLEHQLGPHDTEEHRELLDSNSSSILTRYRLWGLDNAHLIHRPGGSNRGTIQRILALYAL